MIISEITDILDSFRPVRLDEMNHIRLMDRIDSKYLIPLDRLEELLIQMRKAYKILEINNFRIFPYSTIYLDTSDYLFFNQHVTGQYERNKVRYRRYEITGKTFLEVKKKMNGNRTIKWRISHDHIPGKEIDAKAGCFISEHIPFNELHLRPVLENKFNRITLTGTETNERVTIDTDLFFSDLSDRNAGFPSLAVIELKRERFNNGSPLTAILKEYNVHSTGFSKYCIGTALVSNNPKKNVLKPKLLLINKIENECRRNNEFWRFSGRNYKVY